MLDSADPWAADLLLSALAAAAASYRRATCTVPFPSALFGDGEARDYAALLQNLQALPPLGASGAASRLSAQQRELVSWLLAHPRRPVAGMRRCTLRQVQEQVRRLAGWQAAWPAPEAGGRELVVLDPCDTRSRIHSALRLPLSSAAHTGCASTHPRAPQPAPAVCVNRAAARRPSHCSSPA